MLNLKPWQIDATLNIENEKDKSGLIIAATGSGKSIIMFNLIEKYPKERFLIVVPSKILFYQHAKNLISKFNICTKDEIALIGDGHKDVPGKRVTIAIVNSLSKVNWAYPACKFDWLLMDEMHHYFSPENVKFLLQPNFTHKIGMTATLKDELLAPAHRLIGPTLYELDLNDSTKAGYVAKFKVEKVKCFMTDPEKEVYTVINSDVTKGMNIFGRDFMKANALVVRKQFRDPYYRYAIELMKKVQDRKSFLANVVSKTDAAVQLCLNNQTKKILIFDEMTDSSDRIYDILVKQGLNPVIYHSKIKKKQKNEAIAKFNGTESNILVCCRSADEGLDVVSANMGILVNGNSQKGQSMQRIGRILRQEEGKEAVMYLLYVPETIDETNTMKRIKYYSLPLENFSTTDVNTLVGYLDE